MGVPISKPTGPQHDYVQAGGSVTVPVQFFLWFSCLICVCNVNYAQTSFTFSPAAGTRLNPVQNGISLPRSWPTRLTRHVKLTFYVQACLLPSPTKQHNNNINPVIILLSSPGWASSTRRRTWPRPSTTSATRVAEPTWPTRCACCAWRCSTGATATAPPPATWPTC